MGLANPPTPQKPKIQARPVKLETPRTKISVGAVDMEQSDNSLLMKRKGKKATRAVSSPSNTGLNMG